MASGGGGGLSNMVLARGMTKEVKGDMWVHQRQLGADGGGGGKLANTRQRQRGGIVIFFLGCAMCLWAPRSCSTPVPIMVGMREDRSRSED